jgi:hypothetical protein
MLGMLRRMALVRTDVSKKLSATIIRATTRIDELGETLAVTYLLLVTSSVDPSSTIILTLIMEGIISSEMSVLTRATRRNISEDASLQEKSFI